MRSINYTYRANKFNLVWKQKEASNKKTLANQLGGVSKVISSIANDVGVDATSRPTNQEKPKYKIEIGVSKATKKGEEMSGDSSIQSKLADGKYMLAISDGMGSRKIS